MEPPTSEIGIAQSCPPRFTERRSSLALSTFDRDARCTMRIKLSYERFKRPTHRNPFRLMRRLPSTLGASRVSFLCGCGHRLVQFVFSPSRASVRQEHKDGRVGGASASWRHDSKGIFPDKESKQNIVDRSHTPTERAKRLQTGHRFYKTTAHTIL